MDHSHHDHHDHSHNHHTEMSESPTADASSMGHGVGDMEMAMMQMYFTAGCDVIILFKGWHVTTVGGIVGSAIGIFFLAVIYEALKYFREYLFRQAHAHVNYSAVSEGEGGVPKVVQGVQRSIRNRILSMNHFMQTGLHLVQVTLSYFLMLIFMTFNAWLCIAIIVGAGVGFFIFGWKKTIVVDITEHCH